MSKHEIRSFLSVERSLGQLSYAHMQGPAQEVIKSVRVALRRGDYASANDALKHVSFRQAADAVESRSRVYLKAAYLLGASRVYGSLGAMPARALHRVNDNVISHVAKVAAGIVGHRAEIVVRSHLAKLIAREHADHRENQYARTKRETPYQTLYVRRELLNASQVVSWARSQGFQTTLPPADMHVTVAYSKEPVPWGRLELDDDTLDVDGVCSLQQFGDNATVLEFDAPGLEGRHQYFRALGAAWKHPTYRPHVTVTYDPGDVDVSGVEPYAGLLQFGPEIAEVVDSNWQTVEKRALASIPVWKDDLADRLNAAVDGNARMMASVGANLSTSRLVSYGFLSEAVAEGVASYKLDVTLDERTSEICRHLHDLDPEFQVRPAFELAQAALMTSDPEALKTVAPFLSASKIEGMSDEDLAAQGVMVPPFHFGCRTILVRSDEDQALQPPAVEEAPPEEESAPIATGPEPIATSEKPAEVTPEDVQSLVSEIGADNLPNFLLTEAMAATEDDDLESLYDQVSSYKQKDEYGERGSDGKFVAVGGPLSAPEKEKASAALDKIAGGRETVKPSMFKSNSTGLPHGATDDDGVERSIKLDDLAATQHDIDVAGVRRYIEGSGREQGKLPLVVGYKGQMLIADGHHRLAAEKLAGRETTKVLYAEVDEVDHVQWTATFKDLKKDEYVTISKKLVRKTGAISKYWSILVQKESVDSYGSVHGAGGKFVGSGKMVKGPKEATHALIKQTPQYYVVSHHGKEKWLEKSKLTGKHVEVVGQVLNVHALVPAPEEPKAEPLKVLGSLPGTYVKETPQYYVTSLVGKEKWTDKEKLKDKYPNGVVVGVAGKEAMVYQKPSVQAVYGKDVYVNTFTGEDEKSYFGKYGKVLDKDTHQLMMTSNGKNIGIYEKPEGAANKTPAEKPLPDQLKPAAAQPTALAHGMTPGFKGFYDPAFDTASHLYTTNGNGHSKETHEVKAMTNGSSGVFEKNPGTAQTSGAGVPYKGQAFDPKTHELQVAPTGDQMVVPKATTGKAPETKTTGLPEADEAAKVTAGFNVETKVLDVSGWKKVGEQKGSNPGGTYQDQNGQKWYVKVPGSVAHVQNEKLANELYRLAGASVPQVEQAVFNGKAAVASKIVEGDQKTLASTAFQAQALPFARKDFAADAWLANWDSVGTGKDNMLVNQKTGAVTRIDQGGALLYRAQGTEKGSAFGTKVSEWDTLRDPSKNKDAADVFKGMTKEELRASAEKLKDLDIDKITSAVNKYGPGTAQERAALGTKMLNRLQDIGQRVKNLGAASAGEKPHLVNGLPVSQSNYDALPYTPHGSMPEKKGTGGSLTYAEKSAIRGYTESAYTAFNAAMRKGSITDDQYERQRGIQQGLAKLDGYNGVTWRKTDLPAAEADKFQVGKVVEFRGATSTSKNEEVWSGDYLFEVHGRSGVDLNKHDLSSHKSEQEVMFPHGSAFKVLRVETVSGFKRKFTIQEVPW
jgi:hypothetical protein